MGWRSALGKEPSQAEGGTGDVTEEGLGKSAVKSWGKKLILQGMV